MNSERLPGKVLRDLNGRPLLAYVLERLEHASQLDGIVIAISEQPHDDPIARFCEESDADCFRGPLEDVASRFIGAAEAHSLDGVLRVSGDSPLLDQRLVDRAVELFRRGAAELVSNVYPRRCPRGESVEVISLAALRAALPLMGPREREHVTLALYENPERFTITGFDLGPEDLSGVSLAVDSSEDANLAAAILERMDRPHWDYDVHEVLALRAAVVGGAA